jgi:hypothetical protein
MSSFSHLIPPRITPVLDPSFRPASLFSRAFSAEVKANKAAVPIRIALEQTDGSIFRFDTGIFPQSHPSASGNYIFIERLLKFLLWSRGGFRIFF